MLYSSIFILYLVSWRIQEDVTCVLGIFNGMTSSSLLLSLVEVTSITFSNLINDSITKYFMHTINIFRSLLFKGHMFHYKNIFTSLNVFLLLSTTMQTIVCLFSPLKKGYSNKQVFLCVRIERKNIFFVHSKINLARIIITAR